MTYSFIYVNSPSLLEDLPAKKNIARFTRIRFKSPGLTPLFWECKRFYLLSKLTDTLTDFIILAI